VPLVLLRLTPAAPMAPMGSVWACRGRTPRRPWPNSRLRGDATCRAYLAACRWPDGYRCSRGAHAEAFELASRGLWQCKGCGRQTSVTAGTVLHRTRVALSLWFWAAYLVTTHTPGMSVPQPPHVRPAFVGCPSVDDHAWPRATCEVRPDTTARRGLPGAGAPWLRPLAAAGCYVRWQAG